MLAKHTDSFNPLARHLTVDVFLDHPAVRLLIVDGPNHQKMTCEVGELARVVQFQATDIVSIHGDLQQMPNE